MDEMDNEKYDQLFAQVQAVIQTPQVPAEGTLQIHLYCSQTWGKPTCWSAFLLPSTPGQVLVNRVQWKSKQDIQRIQAEDTELPTPTLIHSQAPLALVSFEALMSVGRKIRVPLFDVKMAGGFDGAHYGALLPRPAYSPLQHDIRLEWWQHGAKAWEPFTGWVVRMIDLFEAAF